MDGNVGLTGDLSAILIQVWNIVKYDWMYSHGVQYRQSLSREDEAEWLRWNPWSFLLSHQQVYIFGFCKSVGLIFMKFGTHFHVALDIVITLGDLQTFPGQVNF